MKKILIICNVASYHQVEFFDELAKSDKLQVKVLYQLESTFDRNWKRKIVPSHDFELLRRINITKSRALYWNFGLIKEIRRFQPDRIILTQYANLNQLFLLWMSVLLRSKKIILWTERPGISFNEAPVLSNNFLRIVGRQLSLLPLKLNNSIQIWGIGRFSCEYYDSLVTRKVFNVPYYSDIQKFSKSKTVYNESNTIKLLFAGKFIKRKGLDLIIEVVNSNNFPNIEFHFLGTGPLQKEVIDLCERNVCCFHHGFVEREQMADFYSDKDVLILPGRHDGWGMVIQEAMASGLGIISTRNVGAALDLVDSENGILIEPSKTSLSQAIEVLDYKTILRWRSNSIQRARSVNVVEGKHWLEEILDD